MFSIKNSKGEKLLVRRVVHGDEEVIKDLSRGIYYEINPGRETDYLGASIYDWAKFFYFFTLFLR